MEIKIVEDKINLEDLKRLAQTFYVSMIKGVVDIEKNIVAFGGEYHMDANVLLIENGSKQKDIWGFNLYFDKPRENWIEYTSLVNIRPAVNNLDMEVQDEEIKERMREIINSKIK
jgi:hypothetical protein